MGNLFSNGDRDRDLKFDEDRDRDRDCNFRDRTNTLPYFKLCSLKMFHRTFVFFKRRIQMSL